MDITVTMTLALPASIAQEVLRFVRTQVSKQSFADHAQEGERTVEFPIGSRSLHSLTDGKLSKVVKLVVLKHGQFYNDELADELHVDAPLTSIYLGQLTKKLRKFGAKADGFRGENWYVKRRVSGRTLLVVRPDVLKLLQEAAGNPAASQLAKVE